jgi:hypothetical protein
LAMLELLAMAAIGAETKNAIEIAARTSSMSAADSQKNDDPTQVPQVFTATANSL